jgi:hypothetical protein
VGGPACESVKTQGRLIKTARPAPWISDLTADDACARLGPHRAPGARVHDGPAVLKRRGMRSSPSARDRTAQDARKRWAAATSLECGGARRELAGAALDYAVGHHFARERALRVAERHAHASRASGRWIGLPRRPAPEGGGVGFAGVRVPVLRCELKGKAARKMMLTTRGNVGRAHGQRGGSSDGVRRRQRLGRRSGRRGPKLRTLLDSGGGFPWSTSIT